MDTANPAGALLIRIGLSTFLTAVALIDLRDRRVPNRVVQPLLIVALAANALRLGLGELRLIDMGLISAAWAVCAALWTLHAFGGGDMKLVMALVAFFPDQRFIFWLLGNVLAGLLIVLVVGEGRAGLRRLSILLLTASQGVLPGRNEIMAAYQARGRPITFAISLAGVLYLWLSWPGV